MRVGERDHIKHTHAKKVSMSTFNSLDRISIFSTKYSQLKFYVYKTGQILVDK